MEFKINTDLEHTLPAVIDFNCDELEAELSGKLADYRGLVITADGIKAGKEDRARLNKLKAAVEDRRKEVKKQCLAPYEAFEAKCKILTGMIDEASGSIDAQLKAFEEQERADRRAALASVYETGIGEYAELVPFDRLLDPKWLNKSTSAAAASGALCAAMQKIVSEVKVIRGMRLECEAQVLDVYFNTLDMTAALAEKARFEARREQLSKTVPTAPEPPEERPQEAPEAPEAEETKDLKVVFYATTAAFRADMKALTERHHIRYGGLK